MATNNCVDVPLSGNTGTGNFVGANTPTLITPVLGAATATSLAFSPTTGGIIGTTTNDNAGSGKVGEFVSSVISSGSAISISNSIAKNLTSISLTAGDWDVWGNVGFIVSGSGALTFDAWTSTTSATLPDLSLYNGTTMASALMGTCGVLAPLARYSLSATTTIFISAFAAFASGTVTMCGAIYARRVR